MKIIKTLSEQIKEELHGAKEYIKLAIHLKTEYPELAKAYSEMAEQEMNHSMRLHGFAVQMIAEQRKVSEPPKYMIEMWDEEHVKIMERFAKVKALQEMFRGK